MSDDQTGNFWIDIQTPGGGRRLFFTQRSELTRGIHQVEREAAQNNVEVVFDAIGTPRTLGIDTQLGRIVIRAFVNDENMLSGFSHLHGHTSNLYRPQNSVPAVNLDCPEIPAYLGLDQSVTKHGF